MRIEAEDRPDAVINVDIPFAIHALNRLPVAIRGRVMMALMKAAKKTRPSEADKALMSLFSDEARYND